MKALIISLNSKYIHSALSVWYLKANSHAKNCEVMEFTINEPIHYMFHKIAAKKPDLAAFSCYIWNIEQTLKLCELIKKAFPNIKILLGGPEVSYDAVEILEQNPFIDYILLGEGEHSFAKLLIGDIPPGIVYRSEGKIKSSGEYQIIKDLDSILSPYTDEMLNATKGRIVYFESSRGCPFSCSYCLSSTFDGVRYFSLDRVKKELKKLCLFGVGQIKFVDRTFNCNEKRAMDIIDFIIKETKDTRFHFEIAADLLNDEIINLLGKAPCGKIQLEIGVQSVNEQSLKAVDRKTDTQRLLENVKKLYKLGNIHLHLDLIAGLPYEDFQSFANSFDMVYKAMPHQLQLGFLKLLKGSKIRNESKHGYQFASFAPYEVISNNYITVDELITLKKMEDVLDRYYNSGRFSKTLEYLVKEPFSFYKSLCEFLSFNSPPSVNALYRALFDYASNRQDALLIKAILKLDYLSSTRFGRLPSFLVRKLPQGFNEKCYKYLKENEGEIPVKEKLKNVKFEIFDYDLTVMPYTKKETVLLFDYTSKNPVTGRYFYKKVNI